MDAEVWRFGVENREEVEWLEIKVQNLRNGGSAGHVLASGCRVSETFVVLGGRKFPDVADAEIVEV